MTDVVASDDSTKPSVTGELPADAYVVLHASLRLGVVYQDASGAIIYANRAAERVLGLRFDALCGRTSMDPRWEAIHEDGSPFPGDTHPSMVALRTGEPVRGVVMGIRRGDTHEVAWLVVDGFPYVRPGDAAPSLVFTTFEDITEVRRAEDALRTSEERLRLSTELAGVGHYDLDLASGRLFWSPTTAELYGVAPGAVTTLDAWMMLLHDDDRPRLRVALASASAASDDGAVRLEHRVRRAGGGERWLSLVGRLLFGSSGERTRQVGVVLDISARVEVASLREADRRKDAFLAMLSHELRNPLTPIRNAVYVLARDDVDDAARQRTLSVLSRQTEQLTSIVDELLDVSRLTTRKMSLRTEPIDLCELVRRSVEDNRAAFESRRISLSLRVQGEPIPVEVDRHRFQQVVANLLQNAAKYTDPGGVTTVSTRKDPSTCEAVIEVADSGIGMSPDVLARAFEPFTQADTTLDRRAGGLGLGLAFVKGVVELHGGRVSARSDGYGKGSTFEVRIRLGVSVPERREPETDAAPASGLRVLIIEDNLDAAEILRMALETGPYEVQVAHGGHEGLALARTFTPDVVLCDLGLPGLDGFEVARAIRRDPALEGTYLVALSGYGQPDDVARAKRAGFDRHLTKPSSIPEIEGILASRQAASLRRDVAARGSS